LLGTSHYGQPERFGLTHKPFTTPFGTLQPNTELIDWLATRAGRVGGDGRLLPRSRTLVGVSMRLPATDARRRFPHPADPLRTLCESLAARRAAEHDDYVYRFFDTLGELAELHASELFWVLGVDLAHNGQTLRPTG
jgi:hypothetical protein